MKNLILTLDNRWNFLFISISALTFMYLAQEFMLTEDMYYQTLGEQMTMERIEEYMSQQKKYQWVGYLFIPLVYLIKFSLISLCLITGTLLADIKISFKQVFGIVVFAEIVFLIPTAIRVVWFGFIDTDFTLAELSSFMPLSLANLFDVSKLEIWWVYPFQLANLFEVIYWLLLAYGLHLHTQREYERMLRLVLSSYGSGLLLWVVVVMFLNVNFS
jgi:hypothetical protein